MYHSIVPIIVPTRSYPGGHTALEVQVSHRYVQTIRDSDFEPVAQLAERRPVRNIRPAEHTIVIDQNPAVCEWWASWRRSKRGRDIEIHNCDGIDWLRYSLGCTKYSAAPGRDAAGGDGRSSGSGSRFALPGCAEESSVTGRCRSDRRLVMGDFRDRISQNSVSMATDAQLGDARVSLEMVAPAVATESWGGRPSPETMAEAFIFADPPYVLSERSGGRIYECELTDADHQRFIGTVTRLDASRYRAMVCGYACNLYASLDPAAKDSGNADGWFSIDHRVPTRGGLQEERIWMNYQKPVKLHDYQYIGDGRRSRERIRRRQKNWHEQLIQMPDQERLAMLEILNASLAPSLVAILKPREANQQPTQTFD